MVQLLISGCVGNAPTHVQAGSSRSEVHLNLGNSIQLMGQQQGQCCRYLLGGLGNVSPLNLIYMFVNSQLVVRNG